MGSASSQFDIVVVGGGGAALMAAYSAARHGRSVVLFEKAARLGGTTALSVGTICATSTRLQRDAGIDDDPQSHFEDLGKFVGPLADRDNMELRRLLVEEVPETIAVLSDLGVEFMGPLPEPPHSKPRLHAIVPHSRGYIVHLARACAQLGVAIRTGTRVESLLMVDGRAGGVILASGEQVKACRGVIIASGDLSSSHLDYKQRFMRGPLLEISGLNPASTGDGQRMAEEAGAAVVNGDLAWGPELRFLAPPAPSMISRLPVARWFARLVLRAMRTIPQAMLRPFLLGFVTTFLAPSHRLFQEGAILVNHNGERFCDELDRPQDRFGKQPRQQAYIVFDQAVADRFTAWPYFISTAPGVGYAYLPDYARSRADVHASAATLADLAARIGVPPAALQQSVDTHNETLRRSTTAGERQPIASGPFHALGPAQSWIVFSEGGVRIDRDFRVLNGSGTPIPGLYAAGSAGQGGVLLEGHGHHLGWAFTSGRLAGRSAALAQAIQV